MKIIGIDPSLSNTAWCLIEREDRSASYIAHGMVQHGIRGRGKWAQKTDVVLSELALQFDQQFGLDFPELIAIEEPAFGSRGGDQAARSVATAAIVRLAYKIQWLFRDKAEIQMLMPDRRSKNERKVLLNCIYQMPGANEHVRDAAVIALRV